MNLVQKVIKSVAMSFKSIGDSPTYWNNTQSLSQSFTEFFGQMFGVNSGYLTNAQQRQAFRDNGNFSRVINNIVDGIVSMPIRSESEGTELDKNFLRAAIYDFVLGSSWVSPTKPVGKAFDDKPNSFRLESFRDAEMCIKFDNKSDPLYYLRTEGNENEAIQINDKFDINSDETQVLHVFQSNSLVSKQESYNGVGNAATEGFLLKASQNRDEAEANFLENKGIAGYITNKSNVAIKPHIEKAINEANKKKTGGASNFNRLEYINADISLIKTSTDAQDLKLLETGVSHLQKISSIFRLDSILFGDKTKSIFNTVNAAKVGAYTDCYIPIFNEFIAPINKYIGSDYRIFTEEIHILEAAKVEARVKKIDIYKDLVANELMDNEEAQVLIRELLNL